MGFFQITFLFRNALNLRLIVTKSTFVIYKYYRYFFASTVKGLITTDIWGFPSLPGLLGWGSFNFCEGFCLILLRTGEWIQEFLCTWDQGPKRYLLTY